MRSQSALVATESVLPRPTAIVYEML
jgi:hypothetical protein